MRSSWRIAAVAFVIQDASGAQTLFGSKDVHSISIDFGYNSWPNYETGFMEHERNDGFHLDVEGFNLFTRRAERMADQPHLTQRGIYLPDMSFRALPGPNDSD